MPSAALNAYKLPSNPPTQTRASQMTGDASQRFRTRASQTILPSPRSIPKTRRLRVVRIAN